MSHPQGPTLSLRARGPYACFTRPELKVERVSCPVMTPSAARGILEAVLWKPAIQWRVCKIKVLAPIRFTAFRRNEVSSKAARPAAKVVNSGGPAPVFFAETDRAQRNTLALRDVDYIIEGTFQMTDRAGPEDNVNKFVDMFTRRVAKGQHYHQPYLGCREFAAEILAPENAPEPVDETRDLGIMLWDIDFAPDGNRPIFFRAVLQRGVMDVPADPEGALLAAVIGEGGSP